MAKVSELSGAALDWAVATCENLPLKLDPMGKGVSSHRYHVWPDDWPPSAPGYLSVGGKYSPSTNWSQGGPIIDREDLAISPLPDGLWRAYAPEGTKWVPHGESGLEVFNWKHKQEAYHPLIAAMRCYVASKLGEEVEIPKELMNG